MDDTLNFFSKNRHHRELHFPFFTRKISRVYSCYLRRLLKLSERELARSPFSSRVVWRPNSIPLPFRTPATRATLFYRDLTAFFGKGNEKEMVTLTVVPHNVLPVCPAEVSINLAESGTLFISNFI